MVHDKAVRLDYVIVLALKRPEWRDILQRKMLQLLYPMVRRLFTVDFSSR